MEDFSSIVTIVVFIAWFAISYRNSRKKQTAKQPHEEAWPTETPLPTAARPAPSPAPASPKSMRASQAAQTAQKPQMARHAAATSSAAGQQRKGKGEGKGEAAGLRRTSEAPRPLGRGAAVVATAPADDSIEMAEIGREAAPEARAEFDLRQAVVYAEILKPRFEDIE